ncbi:MAG: hypothetical protein O7G84_01135 [Gammaproteobacteria bacterium]|nr:hypothetical protein [Gammaproteobacteria bacterium]
MSTGGVWREGAYAALMREPRRCPGKVDETPIQHVQAWYNGFDDARARLAALEAEMIRGEEPK